MLSSQISFCFLAQKGGCCWAEAGVPAQRPPCGPGPCATRARPLCCTLLSEEAVAEPQSCCAISGRADCTLACLDKTQTRSVRSLASSPRLCGDWLSAGVNASGPPSSTGELCPEEGSVEDRVGLFLLLPCCNYKATSFIPAVS